MRYLNDSTDVCVWVGVGDTTDDLLPVHLQNAVHLQDVIWMKTLSKPADLPASLHQVNLIEMMCNAVIRTIK